ncbi:MAG TPA: HlyD family efflux transporter periplasmic adaptor subunit [Candidatus Sulfotelmatobacter sp.]|jgi:HlyD family secretion protein|nr:HlyD family efflux transporter periplasmic adaptor subunit [Candidatus Sulfotelmatobacter sp.]
MDIQRPSNARAKRIRRILYAAVALVSITGVTYGVTRLRPAAPAVDKATIWTDEVKRGPMVRDVRGVGTLVPVDIRWIPAQTDSRVERIVLRPGAIVKPGSIILELSDPILQRETLDAGYQLKAAQADLENLKVQINSELLNQKSFTAAVRSDYEQAKLQHEVDEKLRVEGIGAEVTAKLSKVKAEQLAIRLKLEEDRTKNAEDSAAARLQAQQSHVDQQRALYDLKSSELDSLHVRASIDGVLQLVPVDVGQHVTPSTNLARVADPKHLKAEIRIPETQAKDITIGQPATVDTRNGIVKGQVSRIDPSVQNGTVTVDVLFTEPLPNGARPDLSVDGTIELENLKDVLYVGRPVHGQSSSTIGLFKLVEDGSEGVRVNVKLGKSSVNTVEILQGLKVGDKVILSDMSAWDAVDRVRLR